MIYQTSITAKIGRLDVVMVPIDGAMTLSLGGMAKIISRVALQHHSTDACAGLGDASRSDRSRWVTDLGPIISIAMN